MSNHVIWCAPRYVLAVPHSMLNNSLTHLYIYAQVSEVSQINLRRWMLWLTFSLSIISVGKSYCVDRYVSLIFRHCEKTVFSRAECILPIVWSVAGAASGAPGNAKPHIWSEMPMSSYEAVNVCVRFFSPHYQLGRKIIPQLLLQHVGFYPLN